MAEAFAALPCKVLWRLTLKEVPDEAAMAALRLGNNTQVIVCMLCSCTGLQHAWWHVAHPGIR